jgi:hypothetical protein
MSPASIFLAVVHVAAFVVVLLDLLVWRPG